MEDSAHVFDFRVPLSSIDIGGVINDIGSMFNL